MPGKLLLILGLWWAVALNTLAANKIIPHLVQTPEFRTWLEIVNLCESPSDYRIDFFGSDGLRAEFAFRSGELWTGVYGNDILPGTTRWFHLPKSEDGSFREGYGEIIEDGKGCIAFEVFYQKLLPDGTRAASVLPARLSESGVATPFFAYDSCDTAIAIASDGSGVGLEVLDPSGEVLGSVDLGGIHHTSFRMNDQLHSPGNDDGQHGILKIRGKASAVNLLTCDGEIVSRRPVYSLPPTVQFEVLSFTAKHLERNRSKTYIYGHKYAYLLTLKNPTQTDLSYEAELICRDQEGFVVARTDIAGRSVFTPPLLDVQAGQTQTFEGTVDRGLHFETDPAEITMEVAVEVYIPWWAR